MSDGPHITATAPVQEVKLISDAALHAGGLAMKSGASAMQVERIVKQMATGLGVQMAEYA